MHNHHTGSGDLLEDYDHNSQDSVFFSVPSVGSKSLNRYFYLNF